MSIIFESMVKTLDDFNELGELVADSQVSMGDKAIVASLFYIAKMLSYLVIASLPNSEEITENIEEITAKGERTLH